MKGIISIASMIKNPILPKCEQSKRPRILISHYMILYVFVKMVCFFSELQRVILRIDQGSRCVIRCTYILLMILMSFVL